MNIPINRTELKTNISTKYKKLTTLNLKNIFLSKYYYNQSYNYLYYNYLFIKIKILKDAKNVYLSLQKKNKGESLNNINKIIEYKTIKQKQILISTIQNTKLRNDLLYFYKTEIQKILPHKKRYENIKNYSELIKTINYYLKKAKKEYKKRENKKENLIYDYNQYIKQGVGTDKINVLAYFYLRKLRVIRESERKQNTIKLLNELNNVKLEYMQLSKQEIKENAQAQAIKDIKRDLAISLSIE